VNEDFNNLDWGTISPHPMSDPVSRLAVVENQVSTLTEEIHGEDGISKRLREVEKTVWKASGAIVFINLLVVILVEYLKK
jgi:hypothetical protein